MRPWPPSAACRRDRGRTASTLRVRMGLHTGEGVVAPDGDYVGLDVHRAARIAAAGARRPGARLGHDPGADRGEPARRRQRCATSASIGSRTSRARSASASSSSPACPTSSRRCGRSTRRRTTCRVLLTSFVGRDREVAEVRATAGDDQAADADRAGWHGQDAARAAARRRVASRTSRTASSSCPLAPITDPALVAPTIAAALGVREGETGHRPSARRAPRATDASCSCSTTSSRSPARPACVAELLAGRPGRARRRHQPRAAARLRRAGVPRAAARRPRPRATCRPLEATDRSTRPSRSSSTRAMAARPDFAVTNENAPAVAEITADSTACRWPSSWRRRASSCSRPQAMLPRLESRLALLDGGGARDLPARQQTLRGAIDWSYDLLDEPDRCLFARASVFSAASTSRPPRPSVRRRPRAAPPLDVLDGLGDLADQSLVRRSTDHGEVRFRHARDDPRVRRSSGSTSAARRPRSAIDTPPGSPHSSSGPRRT